MAFEETLRKAKKASEYQNENCSLEESETSESEKLFQEICTLQQQVVELQSQSQQEKLRQNWANPLASDEVNSAIEILEKRLKEVNESKESCLNILRNPQSSSENSLSLSRNSQADFIQVFQTLSEIIESKQTHLANSSWINNQNWSNYDQDLDQINKKLLTIEASLATKLQEINAIRRK